MNQIFSLKLLTLLALLVGTSLVSVLITIMVTSKPVQPQLLTCPPCKPASSIPSQTPYRKVDRVPNDDGETF
jgi:hypothetical protein